MIRTRFAPSPTGELHIGGVRTALFSYLFAKHENGQFYLRIEDTDRERYVEGSVDGIKESLQWLGIRPDNYDDILVQSERTEIYKKHALTLVEKGAAYVCECSKERLLALRNTQNANKQAPMYDRACVDKNLEYKEGCVIRLKMPTNDIVVDDLIRGKVKFDGKLVDDPVILKSDGFPTYHLASVVDDHEMEISHVIRAEEWLSSTPKHITLYQAFDWQAPAFAHLPMILGTDKKKLSKRHGATAVLEYKTIGYLPDAVVNFLALLGWNPGDECEEFSAERLISDFRLENVNKSPAIFDIDKLNHINESYIRGRDFGQLKNELQEAANINDLTDGEIALAKRGGFKTLVEIADYLKKLRAEPDYQRELLIFNKSDAPTTQKGLNVARQKLATASVWSEEELQNLLSETVAGSEMTNGDVFWPVRVALSGKEKSPSPVELLIALDRTESLKRIDYAIAKLL